MADYNYKGRKIYYSIEGKGDKVPLILLHGFLEDSNIWKAIVKKLKNERQVVCIDLPGHGRSEGIAEEHTMLLMADVVNEIRQDLNIKEISIAGHSMGGYVCLEFLKNFPKILRSVVLINSTPVEDSAERRKVRVRSIDVVGKNKKAYISMAISNLHPTESQQKYATEIKELKARALNMNSKNVEAALSGMKIRTNYEKELLNFPKQKIIIAGKEDSIVDITELKYIAEKCNCIFFEMNGGHNSWLEDSQNLTDKMYLID